jgi:hypothetical protein
LEEPSPALQDLDEAEARLRAQEEARQAAQNRAAELTAKEQLLHDDLALLTATEAEHLARLESIRAKLEEKQATLPNLKQAEARLVAQEEARQAAEARAAELAREEQELNERLHSLGVDEAALMIRVEELKSRVREQEESIRHVLNEAQRQANDEESRIAELQLARAQSETQARERAVREESLQQQIRAFNADKSDAVLELTDEAHPSKIKAIEPILNQVSFVNEDATDAPIESPWLQIDLEHTENGNGSAAIDETNQAAVSPNPALARWTDEPAVLEPLNQSGVSAKILESLHPETSTDRAAALADLAQIGGEEAFELITKSFDDITVEVRNAAARALYDLSHDRAGSFTRALREATPERRRKIGAAIAGSGLAVDAINSLSGEGRERTYDAYSLLFLMAKSGEVTPLLQAIGRHANLDVRLTSIKLLALSNQQQVLSSLRHLAARESLPPEVHSAVMEAIYSISTQARDHAPSLA